MALRINYNSLTLGIVNFLASNSTTVNTDLSKSIQRISRFRPSELPLFETDFPAISVDLITNTQEPDDVQFGRFSINCTFEVGCHVKFLKQGSQEAFDEVRLLTTNVEEALRGPASFPRDVSLSQTFFQTQITGVEFGNVINENGVFQKNSVITLETINFIQ